MGYSPTQQIELLTPAVAPVTFEDAMAEAGRKILLKELVRMLSHEEGSRTGEDIEDVHDMRVAIRRMRSAIRLLRPYFKWKDIRPYNRDLRRLAWALGDVRDLDVMIEHLQQYGQTLDAGQQEALQPVMDALRQRRGTTRAQLNAYFDTKAYRRFVRSFTGFLVNFAAPKPESNSSAAPYQVRHILPSLVYERLAAVRAYETVLADADAPALHALRIEFKRLRYLLSLFQDVLGKQAKEVIEHIKIIQDDLGHLNDGAVARARLDGLLDEENSVLNAYLDYLDTREADLKAHFHEAWEEFNKRQMQQKLATAVLALG